MRCSRKMALGLLVVSMVGSTALGADAPSTAPSTQPAGGEKAAVEKIDVAQFDALRADPKQVVLDVRTPAEYAEGHVPGAINVPMGKGFDQAIASHDKSKPYLVYCHSGKRSFLATQRMRELGFETLLNFRGGIVAWENAGKPMATGAEPGATRSPATQPAS